MPRNSNHVRSLTIVVSQTRRMVVSLVDRVVRALERRRHAQLFVVALVAVFVAVYVVSLARHAESAQRQWGDTVEVLVASTAMRAGDSISSATTRVARVPSTLSVHGALRGNNDGVRVTRAVNPNQILTTLDIESMSTNVPTGWRIVAFPADLVVPQLQSGDRVDVVALGTTIAHDALVVSSATQNRGTEIAVPLEVAATVAGAAANGDASIVIAR